MRGSIIALALATLLPPLALHAQTETIVVVRHGEKPLTEARGQLNCQGLNRALALPSILARFGKPAAIYAANPAIQTTDGNPLPWAAKYSYVRPLATIEPYAIAQGMPVNAQIAADDIKGLEREVLKPEFANALVVIAWEHLQARNFAEAILKSFGHKDVVPRWVNSDYETIYIFRISPTPDGKSHQLNFSVQQENLTKTLSATCPVINVPAAVMPEKPPAIVPPGQAAPPANDKAPQ